MYIDLIISVVIIFFNQERFVRRAVCSVVGQTYQNLDIVVVDDGSDDDIQGLVDSFLDKRIRFFKKENGGAASARNLGIRAAKGQYIAFLDGDDVFLPTKIESLTDMLRAYEFPECVATSGAFVVTPRNHFVNQIKPKSYNKGDLINSTLVRPSCSMYHKAIFQHLGGFPEHMESNEDGALNTVIAQYYPIISLPEALVLYRMDNQGLARKNLRDYQRASAILKQRLHYVEERMRGELFETYVTDSKVNLLFGFLSQGNMYAARQWFKENVEVFPLNSVNAWLAKASLVSHFNLYRFIRKIGLLAKSLTYLSYQRRFRSMLLV